MLAVVVVDRLRGNMRSQRVASPRQRWKFDGHRSVSLGGIDQFSRPPRRPSRGGAALVELHSVARRADRFENAMEVVDRIKSTLASHPIVLFMKGTPQFPMCGFSSRT